VLRTHPPTEERIERLLSLAPPKQVAPFRDADEVLVPKAYPTVVVRPRRRFTGLWY
jgi:heat shock protein HtpX